MSKRNFILLIIILSLVAIVIIGFLSYQKDSTTKVDTGTTPTNFISQFNPFGNNKPTTPIVKPPTDVSPYQPSPEILKMKLMKVSTMPIAGFTVFQKERLKEGEIVTEFVEALRYVARATGNIYQTFVDKIEERKFSGTTIPKVYEAYFSNSGQSVVMRYLKIDGRTIETFVGTLPKEYLGADTTEDNEVKGSFLPNNVKDMSLSPNALKIFYLFDSGDNQIGTTLNFSDNKKVQIFDSPFTEWNSWWPNDKMITLTTKPASGILGYMYSIDPAKKNLVKVFGDISGLTTLTSPNTKLVLYGDNTLSLYVYHTDTRTSDLLGIKTLPEKCVWGKISDIVYCAVPKSTVFGLYPDSWYQGEISFSDQIWKMDVKNGTATMIIDPVTVTGGEEIDGIKLALSEGENYLFFVNKKDSYLWKLDLK